ncbi:hypothetical protein [Pengzhenrongella sp.]|uniref:hypothetical protein n=1 Tax=Pengzhenrongella sp. TaxID=2888820 RepID=UPI002F931B5F
MNELPTGTRTWHDHYLAVQDRVQALLAELTLEEKVAQLGSRWVFDQVWEAADDKVEVDHRVAPVAVLANADWRAGLEHASRHGLGQLTRVYGGFPVTPAEGAAALVARQHVVMGAPWLGISAVVHEECLTPAGDVELIVGASAADLPLRASVRITGATRSVGSDRRLETPVDVVLLAGVPS